MKNYTKLLSLAVGASALTFSANAKDIALSDVGDLILGIYATAGTGSGNTLQVNLGEFTRFAKNDGSVFTVSELTRGDLDSFGTTTGFARNTVSWGVIGTVADNGLFYQSTGTGLKTPMNTVFATAPSGLSYGAADTNSLGNANPSITGLYTALAFGSATANSTSAAYVTSDSFSWKGFQTDSAPLDFGFFTGSVTSTADVASLALYELIPSNASAANITETGLTSADRGVARLLGTFNLANTGTLTYTTAGTAIPEPSSYAAIAGVAMLGFVAARRRRSVKA